MSAPAQRGSRPTSTRIIVRRLVALLALVGALGAAVWLASKAVSSVGDDEAAPPPPATTTAATPPPKPLRIVFPEGFTREQMAARITAVDRIAREKRKVEPLLSEREYLSLTRVSRLPAEFAEDGTRRHLEGFLFPATYDFTAKTTTRQLVEKQLTAFRRAWRRVDLKEARAKNLTPYDVLIIASMVEKETIAPEERPLVAAVIYNRLKAGMPLGIDATIRYGLDVPGTEPLRQSQLESDNPYNTRNRQGLPPTPIANPGLASIQAAAHPAKVDYLYFVRKPDKVHHFFTASESEFYAKACEYGYGC
ncbi:MAG TPA: endolytic transglycosylase MltG [Gaiellaceae bacterium]|nr:endolytic transglycosylase MltG [Gaiellaceae bacterium]